MRQGAQISNTWGYCVRHGSVSKHCWGRELIDSMLYIYVNFTFTFSSILDLKCPIPRCTQSMMQCLCLAKIDTSHLHM
jgi:hypothetical protein